MEPPESKLSAVSQETAHDSTLLVPAFARVGSGVEASLDFNELAKRFLDRMANIFVFREIKRGRRNEILPGNIAELERDSTSPFQADPDNQTILKSGPDLDLKPARKRLPLFLRTELGI